MYAFLNVLALAAWLVPCVNGHTAFTTLFVNGVSQGDGTCVRMNTVSGRVNSPIADITSDDITCGQSGIKPVARTCPLQAGDTVSFQFRSGPGSGNTESIVEGHSGPCSVYMKQMSADGSLPNGTFPAQSPAGDGWFKIMYNDTDSQDQWCTNRVNKTAEGVITTKIPSDIAPGYYLLRPELLALHAATQHDPQFYTGCAQVYITGGTGTARPDTVAIPGYVKYTDQAMMWNLYNQTGADYPEYGPKLYKAQASNEPAPGPSTTVSADSSLTSSVSMPASSTIGAVSSKTTGDVQKAAATHVSSPLICKGNHQRRERRVLVVPNLIDNARVKRAVSETEPTFPCPSNTAMELGNLCLPEVPHWKDTDQSMRSCWASNKYCWDIADTCWKGRSPAVSYQKGYGCDIYSQKCTAVGDACKNLVMEGPADEGKILTPEKVVLKDMGVVG